jgi:hypothetical protein
VSPAVDAVVLRAMEKLPDRRFQCTEAFISALREAASPASAPRTQDAGRKAIGIYVDVRVPEDADSDEILDDVSAVLDAAEQAFREDGWQLCSRPGTSCWGRSCCPRTSAPARPLCAAGRAIAEALACESMATRPGAQSDVHVNISAHADSGDGEGWGRKRRRQLKEIVGGNLVSVDAWAPCRECVSVYI